MNKSHKALKFDLYGRYAFFKNPENNIYIEFSFEHIPKPTLLGVLGSILGYNGKESITKKKIYPEYYEKLKDIKVAIVPSKPVFYKFKDTITNTTGFANENYSQVLNRKVLQDVCWTIYILKNSIENNTWEQLCYLLQNHESKYPVYLGNNSYKARVKNFEVIDLEENEDNSEVTINSIFKNNIIEEKYNFTENDDIIPCNLEMYFPCDLNELNLYEYEWCELTNLLIDVKEDIVLYRDKEKVLSFM